MHRFLIACATVLGATCLAGTAAAAPALTTVGQLPAETRPAGVPVDYVVTPNGLFHASCVVAVAEGERVTADGAVQRADGSRRAAAACAYPRYRMRGAGVQRIEPGDAQPDFDGWVASANSDYTVTPPAGKLVASFVVPSAPTTRSGQVLYYFPGLEDGQAVQTILQPVLAWNGFGDAAWTMTNWNCCKSGKTWHGATIPAAAGDKIKGTMKGSHCSNGVCTSWQITSKDKTSGQTTRFQADAYGQAFDWYFGGTKEVYGVNSCSQYPANGSITFSGIHVYDLNGQESTPSSWKIYVANGAPACHTTVTPTAHTATISFDTSP